MDKVISLRKGKGKFPRTRSTQSPTWGASSNHHGWGFGGGGGGGGGDVVEA